MGGGSSSLPPTRPGVQRTRQGKLCFARVLSVRVILDNMSEIVGNKQMHKYPTLSLLSSFDHGEPHRQTLAMLQTLPGGWGETPKNTPPSIPCRISVKTNLP